MSDCFTHTRLAGFANITMGQSPGSERYNTEEHGLPFLQGCAEFGPRYPSTGIYCHPPLRIAKRGSILISVRAPVGTMNVADQDYCIGRGLGAIQGVSGVSDTSFLYYAIEQNAGFLHRRSQGSTFSAIGSDDLRHLPLPKLSIKMQERIAEILAAVDGTIEKTEFLVAKYQKIKVGLMHDLFTRGVAEDGKLRPRREKAPELYKETPIGWIPREWRIVSIASVSEFITSGSRGWANYYDIEGALFIRIGNLTREHPNFRWRCVQRVRLPKFAEGTRTRVVPGDILISITADLGVAAVAGNDLGEAYVNQHIALVRPCRGVISSRFVGHYLGTRQAQFRFQRLNDSGAKSGLNLPAVGRYLIPRPKDSNEAENIYSILDGIDTKIIALQKDCEKLQMRKSGLMHDLLTGKVPLKVEQEPVEMVCG